MGGLLSFFDIHAGAIQAGATIVITGLTLWLILATLKYVRVADVHDKSLSRGQKLS